MAKQIPYKLNIQIVAENNCSTEVLIPFSRRTGANENCHYFLFIPRVDDKVIIDKHWYKVVSVVYEAFPEKFINDIYYSVGTIYVKFLGNLNDQGFGIKDILS